MSESGTGSVYYPSNSEAMLIGANISNSNANNSFTMHGGNQKQMYDANMMSISSLHSTNKVNRPGGYKINSCFVLTGKNVPVQTTHSNKASSVSNYPQSQFQTLSYSMNQQQAIANQNQFQLKPKKARKQSNNTERAHSSSQKKLASTSSRKQFVKVLGQRIDSNAIEYGIASTANPRQNLRSAKQSNRERLVVH